MNEKTIFIYENKIGSLIFKYDSPLWITDIDGVSSVEIDISESRSPMQIGSIVTNESVKPRSFTLDGVTFDPEGYRDEIIKIIAPQVPSTLTVVQNGESWYLDVIPKKTPEITPGNGLQAFQVSLYAAYPYWQTTKSHSSQIAGLIALFKFPFLTGEKWWISKFGESFFSTLENQGNVPIGFQVTFTARSATENPELYHVDTGKRILLRKSMVAGEKIVVSTIYGKKGVVCTSTNGEVSNGFKYLSVDSDLSMSLVPGSNLLRIDATNREALSVRISAPEGVKSGV